MQKRVDLILQNVGNSIGTVTADVETVKTGIYNEEGRRKAWEKNIEPVVPAMTPGADPAGAMKQLQDATEASVQKIRAGLNEMNILKGQMDAGISNNVQQRNRKGHRIRSWRMER